MTDEQPPGGFQSSSKAHRQPKKHCQRDLREEFSNIARHSHTAATIKDETRKILKLAVERENNIKDRDGQIRDQQKTIESLRHNIVELQMSYERLDQTYQRELSGRANLVERINETKECYKETTEYAGVLDASIKQCDADKHKLAEFYTRIYTRQTETEEKAKIVQKLMQELDDKIDNGVRLIAEAREREMSDATDAIRLLNNRLGQKTDEVNQLSFKLTEVKPLIEKWKSTTEKLEQEKKLIELNLNNMTKQAEDLRRELQMQNQAAVRAAEDEKKKMECLNGEIQELKNKLVQSDEFYSESLRQNTLLKEELDQAKNYGDDLHADMEELKCATERTCKELQLELEQQQEMLRSKDSDATVRVLEIQRLEAEMKEAVAELHTLRAENENAVLTLEASLNMKTDKLVDMERKLTLVTSEKENLLKELEDVKTIGSDTSKQLAQNLEAEQAALTKLVAEFEACKENCDGLQNKVEKLQDSATFDYQIKTVLQTENTNLKNVIAGLQEEQLKQMKECEELKYDYNGLKATFDEHMTNAPSLLELQTKLGEERLNTKTQELKLQLEMEKTQRLANKVTELEDSIDKYEVRNLLLKTANKNREEDLKMEKEEMEKMTAKQEEMERKYKALYKEKEEVKLKMTEAEKKLKILYLRVATKSRNSAEKENQSSSVQQVLSQERQVPEVPENASPWGKIWKGKELMNSPGVGTKKIMSVPAVKKRSTPIPKTTTQRSVYDYNCDSDSDCSVQCKSWMEGSRNKPTRNKEKVARPMPEPSTQI